MPVGNRNGSLCMQAVAAQLMLMLEVWSGCSVLPWWLHHTGWERVDCHVGVLYSMVVQTFTHCTLQGYSTDTGLTRLLPQFCCCLQGQRFASHQ